MKKVLLFILAIALFQISQAQITKGNWMMGGNGSFEKSDQTSPTFDVKATTIALSPNVGYFLVDQFAVGARLKLDYEYLNYPNVETKHTRLFAGPFVRYYFLDNERVVNFFSEAAFQLLIDQYKSTVPNGGYNRGSDNRLGSYSLSLGTAVFLNSSVAIEGAISYERVPQNENGTKVSNLGLKIGFQIHLQKDSY